MIINLTNAHNQGVDETLRQALAQRQIDTKRYQTLCLEVYDVINELVNLYNHKKSSSISLENYKQMIDTLNYYFNHGFMNHNANELIEKGIHHFFDLGYLEVNKDINEIKELLDQSKKRRIKTNNERYNSIIDEQIPNFIKTCDEYRGSFNACFTKEDLDYPLIDGLPLDHDMYLCDGTDLVLYYLRRFKTENDFCTLFGSRVSDLIKQYELCKDIEITLLNINLCELCLMQYIANRLIQKKDLLLTYYEKELVKTFHHNYQEKINMVYTEMNMLFPKEIFDTIILFKKEIENRFISFFEKNIEILVYEKVLDEKYNVVLTDTNNSPNFNKLLKDIQSLDKTTDKIAYLHDFEVSLFDILDLFDNEIFYDVEYVQYFITCTVEQLALFIKIAIPDLGRFNMDVKMDEIFYSDFDDTCMWQRYLVECLKMLSNQKRSEIESLVSKIRLTIN
ncbi:DUF6179 domain-containing protein [Anaerorhabdus sp.]|uniref:DUF6179 domain-containing protein n=1 Tax=Anaerorhabdus sp. TaxID=1872524 RepID=UPI002FC6D474